VGLVAASACLFRECFCLLNISLFACFLFLVSNLIMLFLLFNACCFCDRRIRTNK